jgi:transposase
MKVPAELVLSAAEHAQLTSLSLRRKTPQALALRVRLVLACARGLDLAEIARAEGVSVPTVAKWRSRFLSGRLGGLQDAPRSGAPRTVDADREKAVVAMTLHALPPGGGRWTTRSLAQACGLSQATVSRIWRAHGLDPRRDAGSHVAGTLKTNL